MITDNNPLTYILTTAKLDATGQRWAAALGHFDFSIMYRPGIRNADADGMSRYPHEELPEEKVKIEDGTVKAICSCIAVAPCIEILPCLNVNYH